MPESEQSKHWTCLECGKVHPLQVSSCDWCARTKKETQAAATAKMSGLQGFDIATVFFFLALPAAAPLFFRGVTPRESVPLIIGLFLPTLLCCVWGIRRANRGWLIGFSRLLCIATRVLGTWFCLYVIAGLTLSMLHSCVAEGTLVDTPSGPRRIETLVTGDEVWTYGSDGELEIGKIAVTQHHTVFSCLEFKLSDGSSLAITGEHPVMTDAGWRRADSLHVGDLVQTRNGRAQLKVIAKKSGVLRVYDLTIDGNANFFASGVLVHNKVRRSLSGMIKSSLREYVEAQEIYHRTDWDGDGVMEYAQTLHQFMEAAPGTTNVSGLLAQSFVDAEGNPKTAMPRLGYCFRVLTAQGPQASGGTKSYFDEKGNMTEGYALIAFPAEYGSRLRHTFLISRHGVIYQADLGKDTIDHALQMTVFNPDPAIWKVAD